MADPKSKVQKAIEDLTDLKGFLDDEIKNYVEAKKHVDAKHRVTDNTKLMKDAKAEIVTQVARIDTLILDNPDIGSLIGAPGDGEIETLNKTIAEVLAKVTEIKTKGVEGISFDTKTGKVVSEVKKLEGMDTYQDAETRKTNAANQKTDLEARIGIAEKVQAVYTARSIDKDELRDSATDAQADMSKIDIGSSAASALKTVDDYKTIFRSIQTISRSGNVYTSSDSKKTLQKQLEDLETLAKQLPSTDTEISTLITELKTNCLEIGAPGTPNAGKITGVKNVKKLQELFGVDVEIDWQAKIDSANQAKTTAAIEGLKTMLTDRAVFDLYPEKKQEWLDALNGENPDIATIKAEIEAEVLSGEKIVDLERMLNQAGKDIPDLDSLRAQKTQAGDVAQKLSTLNRKHVTTETRDIFGVKLKIKNDEGKHRDIATLKLSEDTIDKLYKDLEDSKDEAVEQEINKKFQEDPYADNNPGLLRRAFWKLTHPASWGTGKGLVDDNKEKWVKQQIKAEVEEIQKDANEITPAWTLSPKKLQEIEKADRERAATAKEKARQDIIKGKGTKTAEEAEKAAKAEADKEQTKADRELDI